MSMQSTDVKNVYEIRKKDGKTAMRITVEYFDLDYAQLVAVNGTMMAALAAQQELGKAQAAQPTTAQPTTTTG